MSIRQMMDSRTNQVPKLARTNRRSVKTSKSTRSKSGGKTAHRGSMTARPQTCSELLTRQEESQPEFVLCSTTSCAANASDAAFNTSCESTEPGGTRDRTVRALVVVWCNSSVHSPEPPPAAQRVAIAPFTVQFPQMSQESEEEARKLLSHHRF